MYSEDGLSVALRRFEDDCTRFPIEIFHVPIWAG
jgi:hypothetical protein